MKIKLTINRKVYVLDEDPLKLLVDVLREDIGLTSVKQSCREGECGSCSVILDGNLVPSCLIPLIKANGSSIITLEGLSINGKPNYIQRAFIDSNAVQCGFCTPGFILASYCYIEKIGDPDELKIRNFLSGNLCRCTGYRSIIKAVQLGIKYRE
jgi:aerobic carbon-monoxide dehydrogenase small subunit